MKKVNFEDLISVSGMPGLFKMVANRPNGLIVENPVDGKRKFCSLRKHQFTPLAGVSIYTMTDATPIPDILKILHQIDQREETTVSDKISTDDQRTIFEEAVPDYDPDRVSSGDIKKVIKWYCFLRETEIIDFDSLAEEEE
ncbi:MAG: hypothetical protein EA411_07510 [Saprospirales bacterium]|nr:MAG: hypothetical protein EA411_07510 [Saprospirales bacterium]